MKANFLSVHLADFPRTPADSIYSFISALGNSMKFPVILALVTPIKDPMHSKGSKMAIILFQFQNKSPIDRSRMDSSRQRFGISCQNNISYVIPKPRSVTGGVISCHLLSDPCHLAAEKKLLPRQRNSILFLHGTLSFRKFLQFNGTLTISSILWMKNESTTMSTFQKDCSAT